MTKTHKERIEEVVEKYVSELRDWGWSMHKFSGEEAFTHEQVKRIISTLNTTLLTYGNTRYEEGVKAERVRIVEWVTRERTAGSMDEDGHPQDYYVDCDDLIEHILSTTTK